MNIRTLAPICVLSLVACLGTATVAIAGWTGPYGGVTLGGGGSEVEALPVYDPTLILLSNNTLSAGTVLGGATAGYDFQINNIVLGALVEADFGRMKAHGGFNEDDASDIPWGTSASWLASARAKIGTGNDDVMIYGTGVSLSPMPGLSAGTMKALGLRISSSIQLVLSLVRDLSSGSIAIGLPVSTTVITTLAQKAIPPRFSAMTVLPMAARTN